VADFGIFRPHRKAIVFFRLVWAVERARQVVEYGQMVIPNLEDEIAAYDAMRGELEAKCIGKWVLVRSRELVRVFDSFEEAAELAVERFGRGPYLIRQVGGPPITLPAALTANG
jgi:hypothetical protein